MRKVQVFLWILVLGFCSQGVLWAEEAASEAQQSLAVTEEPSIAPYILGAAVLLIFAIALVYSIRNLADKIREGKK